MWLKNKKILKELNKHSIKLYFSQLSLGLLHYYMSQAEGKAAAEKPVCT